MPIIIPTNDQLNKFKAIFDRAVRIQQQKFNGQISKQEAENALEKIQNELDKYVEEMYLE